MSTFVLLRAERQGVHIKMAIFAGKDPAHRAYTGCALLREEEWRDFASLAIYKGGDLHIEVEYPREPVIK